MQTSVGSAFHIPVFSNWGAWAGGRWRISGPGATPLMAAGRPAAVVSEAVARGPNPAARLPTSKVRTPTRRRDRDMSNPPLPDLLRPRSKHIKLTTTVIQTWERRHCQASGAVAAVAPAGE